MSHQIERYHDISAGHRVVGHEGKCRFLHGHNYRIRFRCTAPTLDEVGRVVDFAVIKTVLCGWIEMNWDHRFLVWADDPLRDRLVDADSSVVVVPFNPTAENLAEYLARQVGPRLLAGTGVVLASVTVEETRKCSATFTL